jgi:ribosomal protein L3 glutamine methyltransferase
MSVSARSVAQLIDDVARQFTKHRLHFGHGTTTAHEEAQWLVAHATKLSFRQLKASSAMQRLVTPSEADFVAAAAERRCRTREPLAYVLNEAWLGPHRFYVDQRAIVPRSFLAEHLRSARLPWLQAAADVTRVLDLCTGSGSLAICAAHRFRDALVDASDISRDALAVAERNVSEHAMQARVRLIESDLFAALATERYDLILSNPPYVTERAMRALPDEYRAEPRISLAGGVDGLDVVDRIVRRAREHLKPNGWLVMEIGDNRRAMTARFERLPLRWFSNNLVCAIEEAHLKTER